MMRNLRPIVLLLAALTLAAPAWAQTSDAQLRKENERLREENHRLQVQLDDLRQRLESLERQVAQLVAAIEALQQESGAATAQPSSESRPAPLPSDPFAAPAAMLAQLQEMYLAEFGEQLPESQEEFTRRARAVERWVGRINREMRGDVRWIVDLKEVAAAGTNVEATLQVHDAQTLEPIGEPFGVIMQRRLLRQPSPGDAAGPLILEGSINAALVFDPQRTSKGMFNDPPFVGPFAGFEYELNIRSLSPYEPDAETGEEAAEQADG